MKTRNPVSILVRLAIVSVAFIIPFVYAKLGALIDLVTAVTIVSAMIFFPVSFSFSLRMSKHGSFAKALEATGAPMMIWQCLMVCIGLYAAVKGVIGGINELK